MKRILITGGGGFIGRLAVPAFARAGWAVRVALRGPTRTLFPNDSEIVELGDFASAKWEPALEGVDVVLHLAARAHRASTESGNGELYNASNALAAERLAIAAAKAGVSRMVHLSSVKVCAESSPRNEPLNEDTPCNPQDDYGRSKLKAELRLRELSNSGRLSVTIVRPPLVYGPGVKANFSNLMGLVRRGIPLPLGGIDNLRSLIFTGNLLDALLLCASHPKAGGRTYFVSDDDDVSTSELLLRMFRAAGKTGHLFPLPGPILEGCFRLAGRGAQFDKLFGSLRLDIGRIQTELGWRPPFSMQDGLLSTFKGTSW